MLLFAQLRLLYMLKGYCMIKKMIPLVLFFLFCASSCARQTSIPGTPDTAKEQVSSFIETETASNGLRIVCLGDSVTAGVFELVRTGTYFFGGYVYDTDSAYPARVEKILHRDHGYNVTVYNAGISGDTVGRGMRRLEEDVFPFDPDIVTVCFGLNDVGYGDTEYYKTQLRELFDAIRAWKPEINLVFITPNMLATYVHDDTKDDYVNYWMAEENVAVTESGMLDEYMEGARQVCEEYEIPVCDVYARWKKLRAEGQDITELLASHITHPTREMQLVFADMLVETMLQYNMVD